MFGFTHKNFLVLVALAVGATAFGADRRCPLGKLVGLDNDAAERLEAGANRVQKYYDVLRDPEKALGVSLKDLSRDLGREMTSDEAAALTKLFHEALVEATGSADKPNPFAADNVKHVALHYRAIEETRANIDEVFAGPGETLKPSEVALLNAAAHDIGKIAENIGVLTPETKALYDASVADAGTAAFLFKTIFGHDGLSMEGIATKVKQFGESQKTPWDARKVERVTSLLQAMSARHNAGYEKLPNDKAQGLDHFWQNAFPGFAKRMREMGVDVPEEYPAATGGWVPSLLALIDRGTSLHPSFVEKIAGQGNFTWNAESVGGLLRNNARSVREEVKSIGRELAKHLAPGKTLEDVQVYAKFMKSAAEAEKLGESILAMNDFSKPYAGRPEIAEADRDGFVLFKTKAGDWFRVHKDGLAQKFTADATSPWKIETMPANLSAAQILMQRLVGYPPIDTAAPRR